MVGPHKVIRRPCRRCRQKNHHITNDGNTHRFHGYGSFCRTHGTTGRAGKYCKSDGRKKKSTTKRKTITTKSKSKCKLVGRKWNLTTAAAQYRRGDITYTELKKRRARKRMCKKQNIGGNMYYVDITKPRGQQISTRKPKGKRWDW